MMASLFSSRGLMFLSAAKLSRYGHQRFFSASKEARLSADENLNRLLQAKISSRETVSVPNGFPFEIVGSSYHKKIDLKRKFFDENIDVCAYMWQPDFNAEDDEDGCTDDDTKMIAEYHVRIHKGKDRYLDILCTSTPIGLVVQTMLLKPYPVSNEIKPPKYEGPPFGCTLDETLQKGAMKYLEARGIDRSFIKLVDKLTMSRNKEYYDWLKDMKIFIST